MRLTSCAYASPDTFSRACPIPAWTPTELSSSRRRSARTASVVLLIHCRPFFRFPLPCRGRLGSRRSHRASQFLVGQTATEYVSQRTHEAPAVAVRVFALIESERLLVHVAVQMKRLDVHVGAFECAFQQRPEILNAVGVNVAVHVT